MMIPEWILFLLRLFAPLVIIVITLLSLGSYTQAKDVQFNIDVLDVTDRENIDLGQFTHSGYIMPGRYLLQVRVNKQELPEQTIIFYADEKDTHNSLACLSPELIEQFALKPEVMKKITWWHNNECLSLDSLPGVSATADLSESILNINVPQAYLEYVSDNWDPPSRWDNGIPGLLLDYYVNGQTQDQQQVGLREETLRGNGTIGANLGAWRVRADWQSQVRHQNRGPQHTQKNWAWNQYYAYRAISSLRAKLVLGENSLYSDLFDSFRFTGISLNTDDNMLPPNLRGYAPEVTGVARTNAKVIISQQGRIIYETDVAAGPFRIQDMHDAISGRLDVRVEEQDGSVQEFQMNTANIPYLTRPGTIRYKIASGRPSDSQHHADGAFFSTGEFSWGINNGWSLYGGGVVGADYNALTLGVGRDLMMFGALSFDATRSWSHLPSQAGHTLSGDSYRLSYSKRFDRYDSQVTFAGYRFSERDYMSMNEFLNARHSGANRQKNKEMYTVSLNQHFRQLGISTYLNYDHQTYWNSSSNDRYTLTVSSGFDFWHWRNVNLSLTGYRNKYNNSREDGMYLSLSIPLGDNGSVSYNGSYGKNNQQQKVSYYNQRKNGDDYQLTSGFSRNHASASAYYTHLGDMAKTIVNAGYQENSYSSVGFSAQGGLTASLQGTALHRTMINGGSRLLVSTDGVAGVPVGSYGAPVYSDHFGHAVIADMNSYYRNNVRINIDKLPDNAEAIQSVVQATLTEGAIGYRKFSVIAGEKAMAVIRLADGSTPPFGATVRNHKKQNVGIVGDNGSTYLSGINPKGKMTVSWGGEEQCTLTLPDVISHNEMMELFLPCYKK